MNESRVLHPSICPLSFPLIPSMGTTLEPKAVLHEMGGTGYTMGGSIVEQIQTLNRFSVRQQW